MTADPAIVISESSPSGHRLKYVALLTSAAFLAGDIVHWAFTDAVLNSPEYELHLARLAPDARIHTIESITDPIRQIADLAQKVDARTVVIPDGDRYVSRIALSRWQARATLRLLIMRPNIKPYWRATVKRLLIALLRLRGIAVLSLASGLANSSSLRSNWAPDPVELACQPSDVKRFRQDHELMPDRYWLAVIGAITERKNLPIILQALENVPTTEYGLILAGTIEPTVHSQTRTQIKALVQSGVPVRIINRLLTDIEIDAAVSAADCVVLAHSNEGPSGLMIKAIAAGTRVLSAGARSLRSDAKRRPECVTWVPLDAADLAAEIRKLRDLPRPESDRSLASSDLFSERLLGL